MEPLEPRLLLDAGGEGPEEPLPNILPGPKQDQVVFIDPAIDPDFQLGNGDFPGLAVVVLDGGGDGIRQISGVLSGRHDLAAIHILSHGAPGQVNLGTAKLTGSTLEDYAADLAAWGRSLTEDGDVLLYGCSVAGDAEGAALLERIAGLTQADVAASSDPTGSAGRGGDWDLEYTSGPIGTGALRLVDRDVYLASWTVTATADGLYAGSLRGAVYWSNVFPGNDTITLGAGTFQLTTAGTRENGAGTGDLDLTDPVGTVTIRGAGVDQTFIDGGDIDRVFHVMGNVRAVFENLTIRNGRATDNGSSAASLTIPAQGGGLLIESGAQVTLMNVRVTGNEVVGSVGTGGLNGLGQPGNGGLPGTNGGPGEGGGIYNKGTLTINPGSTVEGNTAYGGGGGGGGGGDYYMSADPESGEGGTGGAGGSATGGGVFSTGTVYTDGSAVRGNTALGGGGGGCGGGGMYGVIMEGIDLRDENYYNPYPDNGSIGSGSTGGRGGDGYMLNAGQYSYNFQGGTGGAAGQDGASCDHGQGGQAGSAMDAQIHGTYSDIFAPTVVRVDVPANGTYAPGQALDFTVHFSEFVTIDTSGGTPFIAVTLDTGGTVHADLVGTVNNVSSATFRYTIRSGDWDANGISVGGSVNLNGGTIRDDAGNEANTTLLNVGSTTGVRVDGVAPRVQSVAVPANGTYGYGANLDFTVTFDENVTIDTASGSPTLAVVIGGTTVQADLLGAVSSQTTAVFRYTIAAGLRDEDGIQVGVLSLNGAALRDEPGNDADLSLHNIEDTSGVQVDSTNHEPTIAHLAGDTLDYQEGQEAGILEQGRDVVVTDPDSMPEFQGGYLLVWVFSGTDPEEDVLAVRNEGAGDGQIGCDAGVVLYGGQAFGIASGGTGGSPLRVDLTTSTATVEALQALIQNVTYANTDTWAPTLTPRVVRFVVNDGDGTLGGGDDTSPDYDVTVNITPDNDPPTVALQNARACLAENADTGSRIQVADIVITNDGLGTNDLSLGGADADMFEIDSAGLYLRAGSMLDHESNPVLEVIVAVDDVDVGSTPDGTASLSLLVNVVPTIALANTTASLAENADISVRWKVADIVVTDDGVGTNVLSLSGADAGLFEIEDSILYLRAGTALDFRTNPQLDVTVAVDDGTVGGTPDDTADLSILVTDTTPPPAPVITGITDDTGTPGDGITNDNTLTVSGTAEADSTIELFRDSVSLGTAAADGAGAWSFDYTGTNLPEGTCAFTATATDAAENTSIPAAVFTIVVDRTAPAVTVDFLTTSDSAPRLTGTVDDPNAGVQVTILAYTYPAVNNGDGTWTLLSDTIDSTLTVGTYDVIVRAMDVAANVGTDTTSNELVVAAAAVPVYRFWSPVYERHFYTIRTAERDKLINNYSHFWTYEGVACRAFTDDSWPGAAPVYRFWSDTLHSHFYTWNEAERDQMINNYPGVWAYEGVAFYAFPEGSQPAGARPLYRFWSDTLDRYFYTMSEAEKDKLINHYSTIWTYKGTAWHALPYL